MVLKDVSGFFIESAGKKKKTGFVGMESVLCEE